MKEKNEKGDQKPYDQTEEASLRSDERATEEARRLENDDVNENTNLGNVPGPEGDSSAENRVATLDD